MNKMVLLEVISKQVYDLFIRASNSNKGKAMS